jgi:hypothetical protein
VAALNIRIGAIDADLRALPNLINARFRRMDSRHRQRDLPLSRARQATRYMRDYMRRDARVVVRLDDLPATTLCDRLQGF